MAHQLDGLVLVPNCDKIVPGMVMAAVRMDVPAVVCSGGPMLAGTYGGEEVSLSKMFEAVGAYKAGLINDEQLEDCTCNCCPSCGSCSGMYTANSMNCLCEAIGIALPGNGTIPAVYSKRLQLAKHSGMAIMEMVKKGITARQIINERSIRNALTCDMALGCSTNTVLHLLAIAYEAGVPVDLKLFNEISAQHPEPLPSGSRRPHPHAGPVCRRRHRRGAGRAGQEGPAGSRCAHRDRQDPGREHPGSPHPQRKGHPSHRRPLQPHRRSPDPVGQHRPGRLCGQAQRRGSRDAGALRPGSRLQQRGDRHCGHLRRPDRPGRRGGHPLRGPQGRPRYAGDAQPHLCSGRHEAG